jgi:uncharacterized membrane protein YfcA
MHELLTDPVFWAAAAPAVLLMGISKSGFGSGFGALAVPLMALAMPVPQAAAIMLPLLAIMDFMGLAALLKHADRALLRLLLPAGLCGTLLGTLLFGWLPPAPVAGVVGGITLVFLAIRLAFPPRADAPPPPLWLGALLGATSGFTSFVAHAGGPPIGFYLLPQRLAPLVFTATASVFFTVINLSKWLPYAWLGLFDRSNLLASLALAPLAPLGVWLGLKVVRHISPLWFFRIFHIGMALTGAKLLWDGLR